MTTTRVTQSFAGNVLVDQVLKNRAQVNKYSEEVSTGLKVRSPGESTQAGTITQFQEMLGRMEGYGRRISTSTGMLSFQDDIVSQVNELIVRGKEIASQAANETNSVTTRAQMAAEVFQLRDQLVSLGNSTYQGRYIFGGADDDDPPFDVSSTPYPVPATGSASQRYVFDAEAGTSTQKTAQVSDDLSLTVTTSGGELFSNALYALERLGRSLDGYTTTPATGQPTGGAAYTFPASFTQQSADISSALNSLEQARTDDIMPERVSIGARIKRLETASALIEANKTSAQKVLDNIQNADVVESASNLSYAQTAFEASLQVTLRALNLSILNFL